MSANSTPTAPAPMMIMEAGAWGRSIASLLVSTILPAARASPKGDRGGGRLGEEHRLGAGEHDLTVGPETRQHSGSRPGGQENPLGPDRLDRLPHSIPNLKFIVRGDASICH